MPMNCANDRMVASLWLRVTTLQVVFQVAEESADHGRRQILDGHAIDGTPSMLAGKWQQ
jgi:hypothetical protein